MEKRREIQVKVGTILISVSLLSTLPSCSITKKEVIINPENIPNEETEKLNMDMEKTVDLEDKVELVTFDDYREVDGSIYTYDDLNHINSLVIKIDDDFDYSFLNQLHNLEFLHLDDYSEGNNLRIVDGSNFKDKMSITITMDPSIGKFNYQRYPFLMDIKEITNLILGSESAPLIIDDDYLEDLKNVNNLYVSINKNSDIDFDDLEHLNYLYIDGDTNYLDQGDISELKEDGVKIKIKE